MKVNTTYSCCHGHQVKEAVLARKRLVEEDVPERIPSSCLKDVCIQSIEKYFTKDAWSASKKLMS